MAGDDRWATSNQAYGAFWRAVPLEPKVVERAPAPASDVAAQRRHREQNPPPRGLAQLLRSRGLREKQVEGDGNCQFRALADQLYGSQEHHASLRKIVVEQLRRGRENYAGFVPGRFEDYVAEMARDGTWGDHVTLQAAADALGTRIHVLTDRFVDAYIEVTPKDVKSEKVLRVIFWSEVHYNSVVE
eukprot:TRINITY_DN23890_c0_g1_i1.p1 TRINITY_DN23890_c0_g1~~TRINITY_DN23890_c0_g1_i1.p1  ORF type:complete len:206 (-),score=44.01 TRINITY_DN23890_c0_g1_i1:113-673(-)